MFIINSNCHTIITYTQCSWQPSQTRNFYLITVVNYNCHKTLYLPYTCHKKHQIYLTTVTNTSYIQLSQNSWASLKLSQVWTMTNKKKNISFEQKCSYWPLLLLCSCHLSHYWTLLVEYSIPSSLFFPLHIPTWLLDPVLIWSTLVRGPFVPRQSKREMCDWFKSGL